MDGRQGRQEEEDANHCCNLHSRTTDWQDQDILPFLMAPPNMLATGLFHLRENCPNSLFTGNKMSQQLSCASVHQLGHFVAGEKVGHFVVLGQFVAQKMPVKQCFFMSASVGHFVAGEEMGHFVAGTICRMGRKWDILSSGTICRPKNAGGTICHWDKMSPNLSYHIAVQFLYFF